MTLLRIVFLLSFVAPRAWAAADCQAELTDSGPAFVAADFFENNKRPPTALDLARLLPKDAPPVDDIPALIARAAADSPALFRNVKIMAAQKVMQFALGHLRFPDDQEFLTAVGWRVDEAEFKRLGAQILGPRAEFLDFARESFPQVEHKIVDKLSAAYVRALSQRDVPKHLRTQLTRPSEEKVFQSLLELRGNTEVAADVAASHIEALGNAEAAAVAALSARLR